MLFTDGELVLQLAEEFPGDPARGYGPAYLFDMKVRGDIAGRISFRGGDAADIVLYRGHIGYTVWPHHRGHRLAARAVRLLLPFAREQGVQELWITCNPDNIASRRTCEIAGAELVEIVDVPPDLDLYQRGDRQKCRYRLLPAEALKP